jgi:hypothetical protein
MMNGITKEIGAKGKHEEEDALVPGGLESETFCNALSLL